MPATILQLSDTHLVADPSGLVNDRSPDQRLGTIVSACVERGDDIDLVILSGDLSDDGSSESYERLAAIIEPLGADVFAVVGNHDDASNVRAEFGGAITAAVGGWAIVALDTTQHGQVHGAVDVNEAMALIDRCMDVSTMVVMHHPAVSLSTHRFFQLDGATRLLAALAERPQVRLVVSGHLHSAFDVGAERLRLLGCPSTLYGISHHGDSYSITLDEGIGARVITLAEDGTFTTTVL